MGENSENGKVVKCGKKPFWILNIFKHFAKLRALINVIVGLYSGFIALAVHFYVCIVHSPIMNILIHTKIFIIVVCWSAFTKKQKQRRIEQKRRGEEMNWKKRD